MRRLVCIALLATMLIWPAAAQDRYTRLILGFPPGGGTDFLTRQVAEAVGPLLGTRVVVENRPGVNGVLAAAEVARSAPDGTTVLTCPMSTMSITPQLVGANLPLDPGTELAPLATVALSSYGFVVAAAGPYQSVQDVLDAARRKPGHVTFASPGPGSAQHLSGELLKQLTGLDMTHVPYRGASQMVVDILAGRTDFMITNMADIARQVQDGALRLLAIGDNSASPLFPEVQPLSRIVPGFNVVGWFGICGQKTMAPDVRRRWEDAIRQAMVDPALVRRMAEGGLTPSFEDGATLTRRLEIDRKQWRDVIQTMGLRAE
jgi:tripartite-type tricarboxylate transporter receptor subunit TctC